MKMVTELWEYRFLVWNLAQRDLRSRYKKSVLGWLWSLINPASTLIIFTIVFGVLLNGAAPPSGGGNNPFGLWLFAGLVVWNFFSAIVNGSIGALSVSGGLLKKVYFPPTAPAVANLLVALSQAVIEFGILGVFIIAYGIGSPYMLLFPVVIVLTALFALGIGLWVSILNLFYRDIGYLVGIALNLLFYATPIVYPLDIVTDKSIAGISLDKVLLLNPMTCLVEINRDFFWFQRVPSPLMMAYVTIAALVSLVLGSYMFSRKAQFVSEEI